MDAKTLARVTRGLLWLVAGGVVLLLGGLYFHGGVQGLFLEAYGVGPEGKAGVLLFLTLMAGIALWILGELIGVLATVERDPFVEGNARAFFRMGLAAELAGVGFTIKCFTLFTFMTAVCALVMVLSGLFALVLAQVFHRAVLYKQENDLTI